MKIYVDQYTVATAIGNHFLGLHPEYQRASVVLKRNPSPIGDVVLATVELHKGDGDTDHQKGLDR